jgi:ribonuclease P protein component
LSVRVRGSAVRRNRVKRRVRAALRECPAPTRNVVVRADEVVAELEFQKLVTNLQGALSSAGAIG